MNPTTVELLNQSAPLVDYNLFSSHSALLDALATLLEGAAGRDARFDRYRDALLAELGEADGNELRARDLTQRLALAAQAALLLQHGPEPSCEAFHGSRLTSGAPAAFGTLPLGVDCEALMTRVLAP